MTAQARVPVVAPATITQHTAVAHGAPSARWWRDHIPLLGMPYARVGSLIVVRTDDWLAYVERHSVPRPDADIEEPETPDDVLRSLGFRRAGGAK